MKREAGTRGKPLAGQPNGVSTVLSQAHMALRWGDDVPAQLCDFLPEWHPVWTATSWQMGGLPTRGPTTTQQWADRLPYDVEQALVYSIDLQPRELRHGSRWQVWRDGVSPPW